VAKTSSWNEIFHRHDFVNIICTTEHDTSIISLKHNNNQKRNS